MSVAGVGNLKQSQSEPHSSCYVIYGLFLLPIAVGLLVKTPICFPLLDSSIRSIFILIIFVNSLFSNRSLPKSS